MPLEQHRRTSLRLSVSQTSVLDSPPSIVGLFLIRFDIKTGYVIAWSRCLPDVNVEGVVEYKSLPSGLHNVTEDVVYFVHDRYAGVSAFINQPAAEAERNAIMIAVGVLVPLSFGRLGKCWKHVTGLKKLARTCVQDVSNTQPLVDYWEQYSIITNEPSVVVESPSGSPPISPSSLRQAERRPSIPRRDRALSDATAFEMARPSLDPFHPALSLPDFTDTFGPLLFPLYRAALLHKRILLVTDAPVHEPCNYVYNLSLLSSLPQSILPLLPTKERPPLRTSPLFNIGIHDIPYLSSLEGPHVKSGMPSGWIACTTDNVLTLKSYLYDVLVTLPPQYSKNASEKVYPKITILSGKAGKGQMSKQVQIKATQRDVRRFLTLRDGLRQLPRNDYSPDDQIDSDPDTSSTFSSSPIVEPLSWPRLAYASFFWWASAGEKRSGMPEEEEEQLEQDLCLLANIENTPNMSARRQSFHSEEYNQHPQEVALVAYFHRLTSLIFTTLSDAVARQDSEDDAEHIADSYRDGSDTDDHSVDIPERSYHDHSADEPLLQSGNGPEPGPYQDDQDTQMEPVLVTRSDMIHMGLDVWSATDRIFVEELLNIWWGRKAHVDETRIRCCGIPIL